VLVLCPPTGDAVTPERGTEADAAGSGGERWGCLVLDRTRRFVVADATGRLGEDLVGTAVTLAVARTGQRPLAWCSDGWRGYPALLTQQYRQPLRTGKRGRPRRVVPAAVQLTQTVKHRDAHGHLLSVEIRAALGTLVARPGTMHRERLNGAVRDRLNALTRKTHAFAKTTTTWDALLGMQLFEHNWLRPHAALRQPAAAAGRHSHLRSPAMALQLTNHIWTWEEFLNLPVPIST
jgi:hypothetical protein